jgi:hypothetical protein
MNDSASLLDGQAQVRWTSAIHFVYIRSKRAIVSGAFRKNNKTRH